MSGVQILKNVYSYYQILNLASSEHLKKWDDSTFQKAVNWAQYCEGVYRHVRREQNCHADINRKILQLTTVLTPTTFLVLNFDLLESCTNFLVETILTNPDVPQEIIRSVEKHVDPTIISGIRSKIDKRLAKTELDKAFFILGVQYDEELHHSQSSKVRDAETYAGFLLRNVFMVWQSMDSKSRFHQYFSSLCDRVASLNKGWDVLVFLFLSTDVCSLQSDGYRAMQDDVIKLISSWILFQAKSFKKCPILDVDIIVLGRASMHQSPFLDLYMSCLDQWSLNFQPYINDQCHCTWRDSLGHDSSSISQHFKHLLDMESYQQNQTSSLNTPESNSGILKRKVLAHLSNNILEADFSVWRAVAASILTSA